MSTPLSTGMMWQISPDDESRSFSERVDRAVKYYREKHKYGGAMIVYVHPKEQEDYASSKIQIVSAQSVPPKHFRIERGEP